MSEPHLTPPDALHLYIEEQLAKIHQLNANAAKISQEMADGPRIFRLKIWQAFIAMMAAVSLFGAAMGALGYRLRSTFPPTPIVIQLPTPIVVQLPK